MPRATVDKERVILKPICMDKASFIENIQRKVDELSDKLDSMKERTVQEERYEEVKRERDALQEEIRTLYSRDDNRWEDMKDRIEDGWNRLRNKFDDTIR